MKCSANFKDFPSLAKTLAAPGPDPSCFREQWGQWWQKWNSAARNKGISYLPTEKERKRGAGGGGRELAFFYGFCLLLINLRLPGTCTWSMPRSMVLIHVRSHLLPNSKEECGNRAAEEDMFPLQSRSWAERSQRLCWSLTFHELISTQAVILWELQVGYNAAGSKACIGYEIKKEWW